jgi:hypothetical protein
VRRLAVWVLVATIAALGLLAGQARAGGSAAQDQYTPPATVTPTQGHGPMTPPGTQASAPSPTHVAGQGPTLPFTGLSLLKVVLVGAALLVLGILLRRGLPRRGP